MESAQNPHLEKLESERLELESDNAKLRSKCRFLESSVQDGLETLRARDLQLARVEAEREKNEVALSAAVTRLEAEKNGGCFGLLYLHVVYLVFLFRERIVIKKVSRRSVYCPRATAGSIHRASSRKSRIGRCTGFGCREGVQRRHQGEHDQDGDGQGEGSVDGAGRRC